MTLSIAFNGAFFAWPYQAGVAAYIQERGLLDGRSRIYGTSSGAVVAVMLACGVDIAGEGLRAGLEANARAGWFRPAQVLPIYFSIFGPMLPPEAHVRATGRLFVAIRPLPRLRRTLISEFATREALLDALGGSIAIPGITVAIAHRHARYGWCVDGGPEIHDDDRPGVHTLRVGVGPRLPRQQADHITPSRSIGLQQRFLIAPETQRRELFALGYADARRYYARAA